MPQDLKTALQDAIKALEKATMPLKEREDEQRKESSQTTTPQTPASTQGGQKR